MPPHTKYRESFVEDEEDPTFVHTRESYRPRYTRRRPEPAPSPSVNAPVGAWTVAEILLRLWYWIVLAAVMGTLVGFLGGTYLFKTGYVGSVEMIRHDFVNQNDASYKPRSFTQDGFNKLIKSPEILQQVAAVMRPKMTPDQIGDSIQATSTGDSEVFNISAVAPDRDTAVRLANLYATNAVEYSKAMQKAEAEEASKSLQEQLAFLDRDIADLEKEVREAQSTRPGGTPFSRLQSLRDALDKAEQALLEAQARFTEKNPAYLDALARRDLIKKQLDQLLEQEKQTAKDTPNAVSAHDPDILRSKRMNLDNTRQIYSTRQQEAQVYAKNPPGYCEIFAPAELKDTRENNWKLKVMLTTVLGGLVGLCSGLLLVLLVEVFDERIKTIDDLKRVTKLPLLATLGNIRKMTPKAQEDWAFRTWTKLQCQLRVSPNHGVVCGFTSSAHEEGRSTWINLLSQAAGQCGFRVLTIGTVQMPEGYEFKDWNFSDDEEEAAESAQTTPDASTNGSPEVKKQPAPSMGVMSTMLTSPAQVTQKLTASDPQTFVHIPLPGWVWNLERRKQWQGALSQWKRIENVVIFVELPPASMPESVLLATKLPNVIWLARAGRARAWATRNYIQTLRDARCNVVGAVLNGSAKGSFKRRFARWVDVGMLLGAVLLGNQVIAQDLVKPADPAAPGSVTITNVSFSATDRSMRAEWQKRLTLGPGDVLNVSLFGQPELDRKEVAIGPDGRISFLQATDIVATGLTIDELRDRLDKELVQFYRTPRTVIVPVSFHSKKYYVLGKVTNRGVFSLDRPLTIIEAVARAHGIETSLIDNNNLAEIADLQHSFLMRNGKRLPVDFERLFEQGDLSQNIPIEPDDFLYFASGALKEVYILGEVHVPGPMIYTANATVLSAIANRGGFTDRAYKSRVLVIRGSLNNPRTFIVNAWGATEALRVWKLLNSIAKIQYQ